MSAPTEPGFYWAKHMHSRGWEVVRLDDDGQRVHETEPDSDDGGLMPTYADHYEWGPRIPGPEKLRELISAGHIIAELTKGWRRAGAPGTSGRLVEQAKEIHAYAEKHGLTTQQARDIIMRQVEGTEPP